MGPVSSHYTDRMCSQPVATLSGKAKSFHFEDDYSKQADIFIVSPKLTRSVLVVLRKRMIDILPRLHASFHFN